MKQTLTLIWGLPHDGKVRKNAAVRPLTIGGELAALAAFEDYAEGKELSESASSVALTLAYWTQQLAIDGMPSEALTVDYLMDNLVGEDYRLIMEAMDDLRAKSTAASANREPAAAADANLTTTESSTATTAAASS